MLIETLSICAAAYVGATSICWTLAAILSWRQGETISEDQYDLQELLGNLVSHLDGAVMERDADDVFCTGCLAAYLAAHEWLDENDPTWSERRALRLGGKDER